MWKVMHACVIMHGTIIENEFANFLAMFHKIRNDLQNDLIEHMRAFKGDTTA
jgi:hypothetical protein